MIEIIPVGAKVRIDDQQDAIVIRACVTDKRGSIEYVCEWWTPNGIQGGSFDDYRLATEEPRHRIGFRP